MKGRRCSLVAGLAVLSIALATQAAWALEPIGTPTSTRSGTTFSFNESDTKFDWIQIYLPEEIGGVAQPVEFGTFPAFTATDPNDWAQKWPDPNNVPSTVMTAGPITPGDGTNNLSFDLTFTGDTTKSFTFYYQVYGHETEPAGDPWQYRPPKLLNENTVTWVPFDPNDPTTPRWDRIGRSPWADVRVDCSTPPNGKLTIKSPGECISGYDEIVGKGEIFSVVINLSELNEPNDTFSGAQFFIEYDTFNLEYYDPDLGDDSEPDAGCVPADPTEFTEFHEVVDTGLGIIDYAIRRPWGDDPVSGDRDLAKIYFRARREVCLGENLVTFRQHEPWTRLTRLGGEPLYPLLFEMAPTRIDWTAPTIMWPIHPDWNPTQGPIECPCVIDPNTPGCSEDNPVVVEYCDYLDGAYPLLSDPNDPTSCLMYAEDNCSDPNDILFSCSATNTPLEDPTCPNHFLRKYTWTAEDECGNLAECTFWVEVVDTTAPCLNGCPNEGTVYWECNDPNEAMPSWTVTAEDCCDGTPIEVVPSEQTVWCADDPECDETTCDPYKYKVIKTWTATDACGNSAHCNVVVVVTDTKAPVLQLPLPEDTVIDCDETLPEVTIAAYDDCDGYMDANDADVSIVYSNHRCDDTYTVQRTWTFTDACGNSVAHTQFIDVVDDEDPNLVNVPADQTVECPYTLEDFGVYAIDNCDPNAHVTRDVIYIDGDCPQEYTIRLQWTATDRCGNTKSEIRNITVVDTTPPVVTCIPDVTVYPMVYDEGDPLYNPAIDECCVTICPCPVPEFEDACDPNATLIGIRSDGKQLCQPMCTGQTQITWIAEDACGNVDDTCVQTYTVMDKNFMDVAVEMQGMVHKRDRCLTFDLYNCDANQPVVTVQWPFTTDDMTEFEDPNSGAKSVFVEATIQVPCGDYVCVMIRDELHSLARTIPLARADGHYVADLVTAGKPLLLGNTNDDCFIDILDFGALASLYSQFIGEDTDCTTAAPHPDFTGSNNGQVGPNDFALIRINFLKEADAGCCGLPCTDCLPTPTAGPTTSIAVSELRTLGLNHLIPADLNHDGWLDVNDVVELLSGNTGELEEAEAVEITPRRVLERNAVEQLELR